MKTHLLSSIFVALFSCFIVAHAAQAQSMAAYSFTPSSGTFTALSGASVQTLVEGGNNDRGYYPLAPIGFNFRYNDAVYSQVSASTNGFLSFGRLASGQQSNNLTDGPARGLAAPLWDDHMVNNTSGSVSYLTTGAAPNRVFTMQWLNMQWAWQAATPGISFQVKLYEGTNAVQFVYRQEAGGVNNFTGGASIGLAATATGSGNFKSLSSSGTNPTASTTTETSNISTKPATGQTYTFTPPPGEADLGVAMTDALDPVTQGTNLTYTINLINNGPDVAAQVSLTDNLPANTTFVSVTQNTGPAFACTTPAAGGTGTVTCSAANLATGWSASFSLVVKVNGPTAVGTILSNTASASAVTADLVAANTSASTTTTVTAAPPPIFTVTRIDDRNNPSYAAGDCSLREAVNAANTYSGNATIQFSALFDTPQLITLTNGQLVISQSMRLIGKGANLTTVSGNNTDRVMFVAQGLWDVAISGLTLANGNTAATFGAGAGVRNESTGTVNLVNCAFTNNNSPVAGGGLDDRSNGSGTLNIVGCTFSGNRAVEGGAMHLQRNKTNIINTTISGNTATGAYGGGISNYQSALIISNSTITGNTSNGSGLSGSAGGVLDFTAATTTVKNSIIAGNIGDNPDLGSPDSSFTSNGYNLIGKADGSVGFINGVNNDQVGTIAAPKDPLLLALEYSGGTTKTHALSAGSPAIDKGSSFGAIIDQRGLARPVDVASYVNATDGNGADIGAFEVQPAPAITSANNTTFVVGTAGTFTVTATGDPTPTLSQSGSLPSGVTFASVTGVFSGTPAAGTAGTYPITFTASNGVGNAAVQSFTLTVNQAPAITSGNSTTFVAGTFGSFTVMKTGTPTPAFSMSGALPPGVSLIPATGVLSGTPARDAYGTYALVFTASNGVGSNAVQNFSLVVNPHAQDVRSKPKIEANPGGGYRSSFLGNPGQQYTVQFSPNLQPGSWQFLSVQTASANGTFFIIDNPPAGTRQRFYRALIP